MHLLLPHLEEASLKFCCSSHPYELYSFTHWAEALETPNTGKQKAQRDEWQMKTSP